MPLPDDLRDAIDEQLPPRWSRNNPVDMAGGETKDTIPTVLELVGAPPRRSTRSCSSAWASRPTRPLEREGPFYPDHGLERIVAYHERQDRRFTEAAAARSPSETGKPILMATELAIADPSNAGRAGVRDAGRLCYASANRAVTALGHLWRGTPPGARRRGLYAEGLTTLGARCGSVLGGCSCPRSSVIVASGRGAAAIQVDADHGPAPVAATGPVPATPVLSARRVPTLLVAPVAERRLRAAARPDRRPCARGDVPHRHVRGRGALQPQPRPAAGARVTREAA